MHLSAPAAASGGSSTLHAVSTEWAGRRLHFVGIGGAGMSGLALVAHALGASVTGSDRAAGSPYAAPLRALGIEPAAGHDAANVPDGRRARRLVARSRPRTPSAPWRASAGCASCTAPSCSAS